MPASIAPAPSSTDAAARRPMSYDGHGPHADVGVLLVHGFTGSPQSMRPWADYLAEAGYTIRLPLLPGHGSSWQAMNHTTFPDWLAAVTASLAELRTRCRAVIVCGLSMGGTLTLRLAELHPDVISGIVLVNPSILSLRRDLAFLPILKHLASSVDAIGSDIAAPHTSEDSYGRTPLTAMDSLRRAWRVVRADLGSIRMPVMLFHSANDHVVEPVNAATLINEIGSDDVTDIVLDRSFHVATLDYDAPDIFSRSGDFIARVTQSTGTEGPR